MLQDREEFMSKDFPAQTRWYAVIAHGLSWKAEQEIPQERYKLSLPVLMVNASRDYPCNHKVNEATMPQFCSNLTMVLLESDHWVMRWVPEELCREMDKFLAQT